MLMNFANEKSTIENIHCQIKQCLASPDQGKVQSNPAAKLPLLQKIIQTHGIFLTAAFRHVEFKFLEPNCPGM